MKFLDLNVSHHAQLDDVAMQFGVHHPRQGLAHLLTIYHYLSFFLLSYWGVRASASERGCSRQRHRQRLVDLHHPLGPRQYIGGSVASLVNPEMRLVGISQALRTIDPIHVASFRAGITTEISTISIPSFSFPCVTEAGLWSTNGWFLDVKVIQANVQFVSGCTASNLYH